MASPLGNVYGRGSGYWFLAGVLLCCSCLWGGIAEHTPALAAEPPVAGGMDTSMPGMPSGAADPHAGHRHTGEDSDSGSVPPLSASGQGQPSPGAAAPAPGSAPASSSSFVPQNGSAPFSVTGKAPAGLPISSNAGTGATAKPPDMVEKLGAIVPEGIFFTDDTGGRLDVRSLMDVSVIVVPVFLTCPAGCNTLQSGMAAALPGVTAVPGKDYRVLTVSFDETDTPALAARKKNNFLAAMNDAFPAKDFVYLTGDEASIREFMGAVGFPYIRLGPGNFSHPLGIIVLAPGGKVVRYLYGQSFMPFDLNMALAEAAEGKAGLSVKRVLAYCFSYDPAARGYVFNFMRVAGAVILFGAAVLLFVLLRGGKKKGEKR